MKVKSVSLVAADEDVYDITVEHDHVYVVWPGVVVSNSKRVSLLDVNALISHGATEVLRDAGAVRGQKDETRLLRFLQGHTPTSVKVPKIYERFVNSLKAAGVNVVRQGSRSHLMAMTDSDVDHLAGDRVITSGETVRFDKDLKPIRGGLFDPSLTGGHEGRQWAKIQLDEPLPNPVMEEPIRRILGLTGKEYEAVLAGEHALDKHGTGPAAIHKALKAVNLPRALETARAQVAQSTGSKRDDAVRRLGYLKSAERMGLRPEDWVLKSVPVLPPTFRPVSLMGSSGLPLVSDPNYLYKELIEANDNLKGMKKDVGDQGVGPERLALYHAFKAVTGLADPVHPKLQEKQVKGLLAGVFSNAPKFGMLQRKLLSSTVDNVGRAVISPNPDFDMDTIGLPEDKAFDVYGRFIARRLSRHGMSLSQALTHVKDKTDLARQTLLDEMEQRPVIVNRAPVLHKFGVMAFKPRLVKGSVLQTSPLIVKGFGADFDGDQQYCHVVCLLSAEVQRRLVLEGTVSADSLEFSKMSARFNVELPVSLDGDVCVFHLEEFPHGKRLKTTEGQFGLIDWYGVPEGVKVLAMDADGQLAWSQVSCWSVHRECPVQIVNLSSGRQIFTDDDPRAVFGIPAGSLTLSRATPKRAVDAKFLVPRVVRFSRVDGDRIDELKFSSVATGRGNKLKPTIPLDEDFGYLVGVTAGDGWATSAGKDFVLANVSAEIVAKVESIIEKMFVAEAPKRCTVASALSYGESCRHTWSSVDLNALMSELVGRKARCKKLPSWFFRAPKKFRLGLFAGLMDTDGSVSVSRAKANPQLMANYASSSLRLCQEVCWLASSLGIRGRITAGVTPGGKSCWTLSFSNIEIKRWGGYGMAHPDRLSALDSVDVEMTPAQARTDIVPISFELAAVACAAIPTPKDRSRWPEGQNGVYSAFAHAKKTGYVTRWAAERLTLFADEAKLREAGEWERWCRIVQDRSVTWETVESFEDTGITKTGFDLTVPGSETFCNIDGVILSNTMQFHVPETQEAAQQALDRMLPSRNLLSPADFKSAMHAPGQEYLGGLYEMSTAKSEKGRVRYFRSKKDVLAAYARKEITADTPIKVLED